MPEVIVKSVAKKFDRTVALDNVSFTAKDQELLTLLGPSGCGKSTTLRLIAGLEQADSGEIWIGDTLVSSAQRRILVPPEKRQLGMVFQSYAVWPHMTVFGNVAYSLKIARVPKKEIKEKVEATLELVGLEGLADRPSTHLSGGQQQRVALARALISEPRILLLDEPLSNLDAALREHMRVELRTLQRRLKITAIYVTHDQSEALALSDTIVVMNQGKVEQIDNPRAIWEQPRTKFVVEFLGKVNYIRGKVVELSSEKCLVTVPKANGLTIRCNVSEYSKLKKNVLLCVRPDAIQLSATRPMNMENVWACIVRFRAYLGDHLDYELYCGDQKLNASASASVEIDAGHSIFAKFNPDLIIVWEP